MSNVQNAKTFIKKKVFFIVSKFFVNQQFKNKLSLYSTNPVKRLLILLPYNIKNQT